MRQVFVLSAAVLMLLCIPAMQQFACAHQGHSGGATHFHSGVGWSPPYGVVRSPALYPHPIYHARPYPQRHLPPIRPRAGLWVDPHGIGGYWGGFGGYVPFR